MKKIITAFAMLICLCATLAFSACGSNEQTYERIALTEANYSEYISVNTYFSDFQYSLTENDTQTNQYYNLSCIGNLETSKRINCFFEYVSITFSISGAGTWNTLGGCYVELDSIGNSHGTFPCFVSNYPIFSPPHQPTSIEVINIRGYVLVPQEA
jgi:hypothetical protein